jgi:septum formation protein
MDLILASTSPYRKRLLQRLQLPFSCQSPEVDENQLPGEEAAAMAGRLAQAKAEAIAGLYPADLVIGSDQVAALGQTIMGKPGDHASAREQLLASSGQTVHFYTAVTLICKDKQLQLSAMEPFSVQFRQLSNSEIEHYLQREQPYDCAGSFKWEGLGIALFEAMNGRDPTALEGLPLMALTSLLGEAGLPVL